MFRSISQPNSIPLPSNQYLLRCRVLSQQIYLPHFVAPSSLSRCILCTLKYHSAPPLHHYCTNNDNNNTGQSGNDDPNLTTTTTAIPARHRTHLSCILLIPGLIVCFFSLFLSSTLTSSGSSISKNNLWESLPEIFTTDFFHNSTASKTTKRHTLVVTRCKGNLTWLRDVPQDDWRIVVYEKCGSIKSTNFSTLASHQLGAEECNGYLDFLVDYYDDFSDITVFMHDDGLWPWSKWRGKSAHTPFSNFTQILAALELYHEEFLHLGVHGIVKRDFFDDPYAGKAFQYIWPFLKSEVVPVPPSEFTFKASAHMIVRKEALYTRPKWVYQALLQQARTAEETLNGGDPSRKYCCALEPTWHILFGQPAILPLKNLLTERMIADGRLKDFQHDKYWNGTHYYK